MIKNKKAIDSRIARLELFKKNSPEFSLFREPIHKAIDACISVLKGNKKPEDFINIGDEDDFIFKRAFQAKAWMDNEVDENKKPIEITIG